MNKIIIIIALMIMCIGPGPAAGANGSFPTYEELEAAGAYDGLNNLSNFNTSINISNYEMIESLTEWDANESDFNNTVAIIGSPYNDYWVSQLGYWFYVLLLFITVVFVHGKIKSIEVTCMMMMLLSVLVIAPSLANMLIVPPAVLTLLGVICAVGFGGVLLSLFTGGD